MIADSLPRVRVISTDPLEGAASVINGLKNTSVIIKIAKLAF